MRVLFTHIYSMGHARALCERGVLPRQHLFGADRLERDGYDVDFGPFGDSAALARLSRAARGRLGHLDQELPIARRGGTDAVCYSGDQNLPRGLAYLRRARLLRTRIAAVFHDLRPGRGNGWVRGIDLALCLSQRTRRELTERDGRDPERTIALPWGPDLGFAGYAPRAGECVLSAGKTDRDHATLLEALGRTGLPARVYALGDAPPGSVPPQTELVRPQPGGPPLIDHNDVIADMSRATVVAIPLSEPDRLSGLSELNDAMALAKPVVMTRSPYFDIDIEEAGFGIWVDPGDAAGFAAALERLASDPGQAEAMGRAARRFAEERWNYGLFCDGVASAFAALA